MKAVDTNIVLRLMLKDDADQAQVARGLFRASVFVSLTVILETHWVLGSVFRKTREQIADILAALLSLPTVVVSDPAGTDWAIAKYRKGADLEDALHLIGSTSCDAFATFDADLVRRLGDGPIPAELAD